MILLIFILVIPRIIYSQDDIEEELDLEAMWENTIWNEIEALEHLYYRRSMKRLSKLQIQKALGKLIIRREKISDDDSDAKKIDGYIAQLKIKLKKV